MAKIKGFIVCQTRLAAKNRSRAMGRGDTTGLRAIHENGASALQKLDPSTGRVFPRHVDNPNFIDAIADNTLNSAIICGNLNGPHTIINIS
jgi:hypothetical protein